MTTEHPPLTSRQLTALRDCAGFRLYTFKVKSMQELAAMGLVDRVCGTTEAPAFRINEKGKARLAFEKAKEGA